MSKPLIAFLIICSFTFNGCSWQEHFAIKNNTEKSINITYQINEIKSGEFAIFTNKPTLYSINKKGTINWDDQLVFTDKNEATLTIDMVLPPKSILLFGHLNNDHYEKHDQYFINSRNFNLKNIDIKSDTPVNITTQNFDNFFVKEKGIITYNIK